ncbi:hypothetical protein G7074_16045 [Pedobacter sp. HDW13]|uniref:hypothetical protein n=1 Tax=Pedobacter sp. HDW13 TaxID=2714940 RepID=UPI001407A4F6|nr:hypothetical protein [Pedobacter sp. HDW13]QIL40643.1 hypothetical protein G7074_16045 [Pedobacter sp. HDW13]
MKLILLLFALSCSTRVLAQRIVFDRRHFAIVNENNAVRLSAELSHQSDLREITSHLKDIQLNLTGVILTEQLIYASLTQVENGLKSAYALRQIGELSLEIITESKEVLDAARSSPALLLFAQTNCQQLEGRGVKLVQEVSTVVMREGENLLMDYASRDALLKKISLELKTIRALLYSVKKCMYWAKVNGMLQTANPFKSFINTDKRMVENLLLNYKTLKRK